MEAHQSKERIICDYTVDWDSIPEPEFTQEDVQFAADIVKRIDDWRRHPHMIDPVAKARFDKMVGICNTIARDFYGKMTATVDWECYAASIELELDYAEFCHDGSIDDLRALLDAATGVCLSATITNRFRICVHLPYFIVIA